MELLSEHEVAFAYVEYADNSGGKRRPVIIMSVDGEEVTFYKITSQYFKKSEFIRQKYYQIKDWMEAGLDRPSWVDTITPITYAQNKYSFRVVGRFTPRDIVGLKMFIKNLEE